VSEGEGRTEIVYFPGGVEFLGEGTVSPLPTS